MRTTVRLLLLVCIGLVLSQVSTWIIGWLAAFAWDPATYKSAARNPFTSFLVSTIATAALPVALLSAATGALLSRIAQQPLVASILLLSFPWAITLFYPPQVIQDQSGWFMQTLMSPHILTVFLALPIGLSAGLAFSLHRPQASAA